MAGVYFISKKSVEYLSSIYRAYIKTSWTNWGNRYGKGSYAVITGSSDGIGKEWALQLAAKGFNLVMVARNRDKMEAVKREI